MKNFNDNLFSSDDLPEYDIITDEDIKAHEKLLRLRVKQIEKAKDNQGNAYFKTCKHCSFTYMAMTEKTEKICPKCHK